jgi:hypothetical protein
MNTSARIMQATETGTYNVLVSTQKRGLLGREMRHCLRGCPFTAQVVGASVSAGGCLVQVINDESPFQVHQLQPQAPSALARTQTLVTQP